MVAQHRAATPWPTAQMGSESSGQGGAEVLDGSLALAPPTPPPHPPGRADTGTVGSRVSPRPRCTLPPAAPRTACAAPGPSPPLTAKVWRHSGPRCHCCWWQPTWEPPSSRLQQSPSLGAPRGSPPPPPGPPWRRASHPEGCLAGVRSHGRGARNSGACPGAAGTAARSPRQRTLCGAGAGGLVCRPLVSVPPCPADMPPTAGAGRGARPGPPRAAFLPARPPLPLLAVAPLAVAGHHASPPGREQAHRLPPEGPGPRQRAPGVPHRHVCDS